MSDKRPEDLSVDELRRLLLDKRRVKRKERLDEFRRTGRAITLSPEITPEPDDQPRISRVIDTPDAESAPEPKPIITPKPARNPKRIWADRILLAIEIIAIVGLGGIILNGLNILRTLNDEVASSMQLPTFTATPLISAVVLPSGHTPPNAANGAQPNESEIPEHLRPLVQSLTTIPIPTPGPEQAIRIQIPAIGVDAPVVQGDTWEQLKKGIGQHIGTPNPGQNGNIVVAAHNDIFGEIFRELDKLKPGDAVIVYTNQRQFVYVITGTQIVEPTQVEVMAPTSDPTITLISCYPYLIDNQRIVVKASLQNP
jgi:sortase A